MRCVKCGATLTDPGYCSSCGTEIHVYEKIIRLSNTYYNRGLEKAKARSLSAAAEDLRYSLELNKHNIPARNLLGLIYYEVGEVVSALTEWIISKNLEPEKNIADEYIQAIQKNQARLETINQTIKKYNQSLLYCQQGSEDLAVIQLKKVLSLNPNLVKAHQLLALLYIKTGEYERAGRELRRALAIDRTDNISLYYQAELETLVGKSASRGQKAEGQKESKGNKSKDPDIISYTSGNETIIMPTGYKENTGVNVVLNIFIGLVVGVALMWFLAVPAKVKSVRNQTAAQIREYSDQITAKQTEINNLQSQLDELNGTGADSSESAAEAPGGSYEMLIDAYTSFQAGDADTAATALDSVKADELSDNAKAIYNQMYGTLHADDVKNLYDAGAAAYDAKNYEEAVTNLVQVVAMDEKYDNGYAVYYLARSYEALQQNDEAIAMFQKFLDNYPGTSRAKYCTSAIARLGGQVQTQSTTQTQATTQNPAADTAAQDQAAQQ